MAFIKTFDLIDKEDLEAHANGDGFVSGIMRAEFLGKCNPIETRFFDGLASFELQDAYFNGPFTFSYQGMHFELTTQQTIPGTRFRGDFDLLAFVSSPYDGLEMIIEIDGHDFHEKTKYQVMKEKRRERKIQATGRPVIRFSGSEVYNCPADCWKEVFDITKNYLAGNLKGIF